MLERLKWPGTAALLGVLGVLMRRWQMTTAFEGELGLHIPGASASWAMIAFFFLAGAVLLLLAHNAPARQQPEGRVSRWDVLFAAEGDGVYLVLMILAALFTLAAAPLLFQEAARFMAIRKATGEGDNGLLQIVLALCTIPACVGMVASARNAYRMRGRGRESGALLLPALLGCVWLLESYRANASDPVLWDYVPLLLAVGLGLLFSLDCAGLSFGAGHARRTLWLAGITVVLCAVALASIPGRAMTMLLAGQLLAALAALWVVPGNLRRPPAADRFGLRSRRFALQDSIPEEEERDGDPEQPAPQEIQEEDDHA